MRLRFFTNFIIPIGLAIAGAGIYSYNTLVAGILLGLIIQFIPDEIKYKIRNNDVATKVYRAFDPLRGRPVCESNGIRYHSTVQEPPFDSILEIKGLKQIDILALSGYEIVLGHISKVREALEKGINFNFMLLDPSSSWLDSLSKNFTGGDLLKQHIDDSLNQLNREKSRNKNLRIWQYDERIGESIIIVHLEKDLWAKRTLYVVGSDSIHRPNWSAYKTDNSKFFNECHDQYQKILKISKEYNPA